MRYLSLFVFGPPWRICRFFYLEGSTEACSSTGKWHRGLSLTTRCQPVKIVRPFCIFSSFPWSLKNVRQLLVDVFKTSQKTTRNAERSKGRKIVHISSTGHTSTNISHLYPVIASQIAATENSKPPNSSQSKKHTALYTASKKYLRLFDTKTDNIKCEDRDRKNRN